MLPKLHTTLRRLLYEQGKIDPAEVDVQFERPTRQWVDALTMPTINLFLFAIEENPEFRTARPAVIRSGSMAQTQLPPLRVDLRYLVGAFSSAVEDEYQLIWRALATLLRYPALPTELLADEIRALDISLMTKVVRDDDGPALDLWQSLDVPPRPSLTYLVTAPLDLAVTIEAPLVLTRTARYRRPSPEDEALGAGLLRDRVIEVAASIQIGGVVRDPQGEPIAGAEVAVEGRAMDPVITTSEGRFRLGSLRPGPLTLRVTPPGASPRLVSLIIPADSYDLVVG